MLQDMIEATHPLHSHSRSTSCIYKVFQHLLLWLVAIRKETQADMLGLTVLALAVGDSLGF
jgi:hypothetical protein